MKRTLLRRKTAAALASGALFASLLAITGPSTVTQAAGSAPQAAAATTRTVVLAAAKTAYVDSKAPTKAFTNPATAKIGSGRYISYARYAPIQLAANEKITAASLVVRVTGGSTTSSTGLVARNVSWNGKTLTYKTRPALSTAVSAATKATKKKDAAMKLTWKAFASISSSSGAAFGIIHSSTKYRVDISGRGSLAPRLVLAITTTPPTQYSNTVNDDFSPVDVTGLSGTTKKLVFAHYMEQFPLSIDNAAPNADYYTKNWLTPTPESQLEKKWSNCGGWLRDRPVPQEPVSGDFLVSNARTEIQQARSAGIDGFALQFWNFDPASSQWARTQALLQAAALDGHFKIMLQPDVGSTGDISNAQVATGLAYIVSPDRPWHNALYRDASGKIVISPFRPEARSASDWASILNSTQMPASVSFLPLFVDLPSTAFTQWMPISIGMGMWGDRFPGTYSITPANRSKLKSLNKIWMEPIGIQDNRPKSGVFTEAGNTGALRSTWGNAIANDAEIAMLMTWNDYSESSQFAPSIDHGNTVLDLNSYYLGKYKTGAWPTINHEGIFLSHRSQFWSSKPTVKYALHMAPRAGSYSPRDTVEIVTILKAAAEIRVTIGGQAQVYTAPAGFSVKTYPLQTGRVSAAYFRTGALIDGVTTSSTVTTTPRVQDLDYLYASSLRPLPRQK